MNLERQNNRRTPDGRGRLIGYDIMELLPETGSQSNNRPPCPHGNNNGHNCSPVRNKRKAQIDNGSNRWSMPVYYRLSSDLGKSEIRSLSSS